MQQEQGSFLLAKSRSEYRIAMQAVQNTRSRIARYDSEELAEVAGLHRQLLEAVSQLQESFEKEAVMEQDQRIEQTKVAWRQFVELMFRAKPHTKEEAHKAFFDTCREALSGYWMEADDNGFRRWELAVNESIDTLIAEQKLAEVEVPKPSFQTMRILVWLPPLIENSEHCTRNNSVTSMQQLSKYLTGGLKDVEYRILYDAATSVSDGVSCTIGLSEKAAQEEIDRVNG